MRFRLISRSILRGSWHLAQDSHPAGCRGFKGPIPPPLSMSARTGTPAQTPELQHETAPISILRMLRLGPGLCQRREVERVRISRGSLAATRAATRSFLGREVSARPAYTS